MTVWVAKGLQFPVVYLPFAFNRNVQDRELVLFHEGDQRCLHVGGSRQSRTSTPSRSWAGKRTPATTAD